MSRTDPSPEAWQDIAAMNARVYAMNDEDREKWYRDHPVSSFEDPAARTARAIAAALEAEAISEWEDDRSDYAKVIEIYVSQVVTIVERVLKEGSQR